VSLSAILTVAHVRQGVKATDGRFLDIPILPCQPNPSVQDVDYSYFLIHKLIGDIVYMAGGAKTLGLDEFGPNEDPWMATHLVSEVSLPKLDEELYHIQDLQQSVFTTKSRNITTEKM
jgi:hypothetical protein